MQTAKHSLQISCVCILTHQQYEAAWNSGMKQLYKPIKHKSNSTAHWDKLQMFYNKYTKEQVGEIMWIKKHTQNIPKTLIFNKIELNKKYKK